MGLVASGVLAAKMIWRFRPKLVCIVGIAAGAKSGKQGFGDILAPDQTFDYGSGKTTFTKGAIQILPNPNPLQISAKLQGRLNEWQRERTSLDTILKSWPAKKPRTQLDLHIGPLFSSPTVLDASRPVKEVTSHWRKLIGVEMEAHAVHRACHDTVEPVPMFLCLKSICDFTQGKNDDWQHFAAFTSAQLLYKFLIAEWPTLSS
jgi:nucleoside phosphorylase